MTHPTTWLIANWKMNGDRERVRAFAFAINRTLATLGGSGVRGVFCPPSLYIADAVAALPQNAVLGVGAQNCHGAEKGAHTGEISAAMLADVGCRFAIIGHSERRALGESDAQVVEKANAAIKAGVTPVICVGESLEDYEKKRTNEVILRQIKPLSALPQGAYLMAYEPIWAIGSNRTPQMQEIAAAHRYIKSVLGSGVSVLYGGSVNVGNAQEILSLPEVSGALIGGASLEIETMQTLLEIATRIRGTV